MARGRAGALLAACALLLGGCSADEPATPTSQPADAGPSTSSSAPTSPSETPTESASGTPEPEEPEPPRPLRPADLDVGQARAVVRHLAGTIGPRHGTSPAFREAVAWTARYFRRLGYRVDRQGFDVPGGVSWGVPVGAGRSTNVVATPPGFDPTAPHLVVGAHLDTVPQAPGAEDNASGVGVVLAAADAAMRARARLPVVWVAFGAEEPRGPSDADHHYGSRAYVAGLRAPQRRAVRGMVSLDRVGVGSAVPVGSAEQSDPLQQRLLRLAERTGIAATPDPFQRSSDHWSFVRAGMPGVRLGSVPYAGYHSADDVPAVVDNGQLRRTGRLLLAWLSPSA